MKKLCEIIAGSQLYKLNTPESDTDYRFIYLTDDLESFVGLKTDNSQVKITDDIDSAGHELRAFMRHLRNTNTNSIELMFAPEAAFILKEPEFDILLKNKYSLIDSANLIKSTKGYVQTERRLALGERTGRLGGKRKAEIEIRGWSRKNVSQIIRIVAATKHFSTTGFYPVDLSTIDTEAYLLAFNIKNKPDLYTKDQIVKIIEDQEKKLLDITDEVYYTFDTKLASEIIWQTYKDHFTK